MRTSSFGIVTFGILVLVATTLVVSLYDPSLGVERVWADVAWLFGRIVAGLLGLLEDLLKLLGLA